MSTSPKIESADLSIEQKYKDIYIVPPYQREYVWSDADVDVLGTIRSRIAPEVDAKSRAFGFAMNELAAPEVPKYHLKYVLAKLAQHVEQVAWQGAQSVQQLDHYLDGKFEIEHIFPQKPAQATMAKLAREVWMVDQLCGQAKR